MGHNQTNSSTSSQFTKKYLPPTPSASLYAKFHPYNSTQAIIWQREKHVILWFSGLLLTTTCTITLMIFQFYGVTFSDSFYDMATQNRASVQIVIQTISALLGTLQVAALCRLFNYATRLHMTKAVPISSLTFWANVSHHSFRWALPIHHSLLLLLFLIVCTIPSALWAGAISPVVTTAAMQTHLLVPSYNIISNIQDWQATGGYYGPLLRTAKGLFTFDPSIISAADLNHALASATTLDGGPRQHSKLDNTKYVYNGRSYGVGAAVGLTDDFASTAVSYAYQEVGYDTQTTCIYNRSAQYGIYPTTTQVWYAEGMLPDSISPEFSVYISRSMSVDGPSDNGSIVAIGVAGNPHRGPRYLGIAAGWRYSFLDMAQCQTNYTPALFEVNVGVAEKSITVSKVDDSIPDDMEPFGNLTRTAHRQISGYASHATTLFQSDIGNAINYSISDYRTFVGNSSSEPDVILGGLTNSITAMIDDVLSIYASAQIMIQGDTTPVSTQVLVNAVRFGEQGYILAVFIVNTIILLLVTVEAMRTKMWKNLTTFDYCDPQSLIYVASRSGTTLRQNHDMIALAGGYTYTLVGSCSDKRDSKG